MHEDSLTRQREPINDQPDLDKNPADIGIDVTDQSEDFKDTPADAVDRARQTIAKNDAAVEPARVYSSPEHKIISQRLEAMLYTVEKAQRGVEHRSSRLNRVARFIDGLMGNTSKRQQQLAEAKANIVEWRKTIASTSPELLPMVASSVESLASEVVAHSGEIPVLPAAETLPHFPELDPAQSLGIRKHTLLQYVHDIKLAIKGIEPVDTADGSELNDILSLVQRVRREVENINSEETYEESFTKVKSLVTRAHLEHGLPEQLDKNEEFDESLIYIESEIQYWSLNNRIVVLEKYYSNKDNIEITAGSEEEILAIRAELIIMYDQCAQDRASYPPKYFERIADRIKDTYGIMDRIEARKVSGISEIREQAQSAEVDFYVLGSKWKHKTPKRQPLRYDTPTWAEGNHDVEVPLNELGEDYALVNAENNSVVILDGNGSYQYSAEAVRLLAPVMDKILIAARQQSSLDRVKKYIEEHTIDIAEALLDLPGESGATLYAAMYLAEYGVLVTVDIGDCEGYKISSAEADSSTKLEPSISATDAKKQTLKLDIYQAKSGEARISDQRTEVRPLVRVHDVQPGDTFAFMSDGLRNNLPMAARTDENIRAIIKAAAAPLAAGQAPNIEVLPVADGESGDDEVVAFMHIRASQ